jgi:hypothetical protein
MSPPRQVAPLTSLSRLPSIPLILAVFFALFVSLTPCRFQPATYLKEWLRGGSGLSKMVRLRNKGHPHGKLAAEAAARVVEAGAIVGGSSSSSSSIVVGPEVGAVYVFYRRPQSFLNSITQFRKNYPTSTLVLICDSGCYNYSKPAAAVNAIYLGESHGMSMKKHGAFYVGKDQALTMIRAYRDAVNRIKEPYYMQLEDDVFTVKRIKTPLLGHINGIAFDKSVVGAAAEYVKRHATAPPPDFMTLGGFGGCVYETAYWQKILNDPHIEAEISDLYSSGADNYGVDYIFSTLLYRFGGVMHDWTGYIESFRPEFQDRLIAGTVEVFHGYKKHYDKSDRDFTWDQRMALGDFDKGMNVMESR